METRSHRQTTPWRGEAGWIRKGLLVALVSCAACEPRAPDPEQLRLVEERVVDRTAAEIVHELVFAAEDDTPLQAYLRRPARGVTGGYGIVMVAGRETGREAAAIVPPPIDGLVLAIEYPGQIPEELELGELVRRFPEIRRGALRMPGIVMGGGHWLADHSEVDPGRIVLVGVSFGVPFAAPAARDPTFQGVALLYGGADLPLLFRTHLPIEAGIQRRLVARLLAFLFRDLEPAHHVAHIAPRPLLLINGIHDDWVPPESALHLREAAREPVRQIWLDHGHLMPWHLDVMREMADSTLAHFPFLPAP